MRRHALRFICVKPLRHSIISRAEKLVYTGPMTSLTTTQIADIFDDCLNLLPHPTRPAVPPLDADCPMPQRIEHTLLRIDATQEALNALCQDAQTHGLRGVCVNPRDVAHCAKTLAGSDIRVVSVVDFPLGCGTLKDVQAQTRRAIDAGADEIDMVMDVRSVQGDGRHALERLMIVVAAAAGKPVKAILETGCLSERDIVRACAMAWMGGAHYAKTSTGYGPRGASVRDISLMRQALGRRMRIKASGGIRNRSDALQMIAAGADVIGTSNGPACC